ncbi:phosphatase PAP2 family protein [Tabrizicola sp.]|uniref:phosphatase PAP2 family protein n=1 Tax=Tabrizicola sp. TaxID=2005166 RepID=UPI002630913E|nr:phosphatase PAP2 family protein [Tabrizicola sp.]MDM7931359.1 phosphatase PAP2 family protein [Tabrizicola sp.]
MSGTVTRTFDASREVFRRHLLLAVLVTLYCLLAAWLSQAHGLAVKTGTAGVLVMNFLTKVPQMIFFVLFWRLLYHTYIARVPDRMEALKEDVRLFMSDRDRFVGGAIATILMALSLMAFAQLKSLIPAMQPFVWDEYFAELDRLLHFGSDPYNFVHTVFGWHYSLSFFTGMYNVWLFVVYFALFGSCFMTTGSVPRMQFLIAFLLIWAVGGNFLATAFSSAGPPYFASLGLGDSFAPLFGLLDAHAATGALSVVETQDVLWAMYSAPNSLNTISAFPSMHVASSVLMAIFGFQVSRWLGISLAAFAACIMIGSVLLGWHYAVDGYAGALIAVTGWKAAGCLVRWRNGPFPNEVR